MTITKIKISVVLFFLMFWFDFGNSDNPELLAVVTLYRHGSRAPLKLYKNDPYQKIANEIWPDGFEQLTKMGKIEQYNLGTWIREHYQDFIPKKYEPKFIKILSSNVDRCLMSAASNLAGLFPPTDNEIWNKNIPWIPIPIHTTPEDEDNLLALRKPCSKHEKLLEDVLNSKQHKKFMESNRKLIHYIEKHSGENLRSLFDLAMVHDNLLVESFSGLILPGWTHNIFPNLTYPFFREFLKLPASTPHLARLRSGPLINLIATFFENVLKNPKNSQKILMLSGHDLTLASILNSLGLFDHCSLQYDSMLMFELYSNKNEEFLSIRYKNGTDLQLLPLNNCGNHCSFSTFKKITEHLRISQENWQQECANSIL